MQVEKRRDFGNHQVREEQQDDILSPEAVIATVVVCGFIAVILAGPNAALAAVVGLGNGVVGLALAIPHMFN